MVSFRPFWYLREHCTIILYFVILILFFFCPRDAPQYILHHIIFFVCDGIFLSLSLYSSFLFPPFFFCIHASPLEAYMHLLYTYTRAFTQCSVSASLSLIILFIVAAPRRERERDRDYSSELSVVWTFAMK